MKKIIIVLLLIGGFLFLRSWDDEAIFTTISRGEKPNVVILFDNSASMNEIVYHPAYNQNTIYPGTWVAGEFSSNNFTETAWHGRLLVGTTTYGPRTTTISDDRVTLDSGNQIRVSATLYNRVVNHDWLLGYHSGTVARVSSKSTSGGIYYINLSNKQGTFQLNEPVYSYQNQSNAIMRKVRLYATIDLGYATRFQSNYLKWLFIHATETQLAQVTHQSTYGVFDLTKTPSPTDPNLNPSECNCPGQVNVKKIFTRIQTVREVACKVANDQMTKVYLGVYKFRQQSIPGAPGSTTGAELLDSIKDMSEGNNLQFYKNKIWQLSASTWTPLAESLVDIWYDFLPGGANKPYWPVTSYSPPSTATNRMRHHCQRNYVIIVTDGESTQDMFTDNGATKYNGSIFLSKPVRRTVQPSQGNGIPTYTWNYNNGWGDYDNSEPSPSTPYSNAPAHGFNPYCPNQSCWYSNGSDYLDDVAYFINRQDLYPDNLYGSHPVNGWPGDQNIYTYTIGFNMDNHLLKATAENGSGKYYTANDFEELAEKINEAFDSIHLREQEMNFTAFAAPKQSFTFGKIGYIATFIPRNDKTLWEGHLSAYQLDENGNFPADLANKIWDGYNILLNKSSSARTIYTAKNNSLINFTSANLTPADLAVSDNTQKETVINFIRGNNGYEPNYKLGDIYHFNPIVVGKPHTWKATTDPSYYQFYQANLNRTEVVYAGANDGALHCFKVTNNPADADELWAFIPPSQLPRLKNLTSLVANADRPPYYRYFVDGKGIAKDVKINGQWRTILIFGMGIGADRQPTNNWGKTYVCLDITNPLSPSFMWEFSAPEMGLTVARPVIADIYDGTSTYPAVFLVGGFYLNYDVEVPADANSSNPFYNERLIGKAVYVVRAANGQTVKKFVYGSSISETVQNGVYIHTNPNFIYAFTAPPVILDKDMDEIADYIYVAETGSYQTNRPGGKIYRINVNGHPSTWQPTKIFQDNNGQQIFIAPTIGYDKNFNLWLMFGTGRRSHIAHRDNQGNFDNLTGHFVAFIDNFQISPAYTTANLHDITSAFINPEPNNNANFQLTNTKRGYLLNFIKGDNEIFYEPTPIFLNNTVFFNTFDPESIEVPQDPNDPNYNPCAINPVSGQLYLYSFGFTNMNGNVSITNAKSHSQKILGFGLLSGATFKLYTGAGIPGNKNISTSATIDLTGIFGPMYWKENQNDKPN